MTFLQRINTEISIGVIGLNLENITNTLPAIMCVGLTGASRSIGDTGMGEAPGHRWQVRDSRMVLVQLPPLRLTHRGGHRPVGLSVSPW